MTGSSDGRREDGFGIQTQINCALSRRPGDAEMKYRLFSLYSRTRIISDLLRLRNLSDICEIQYIRGNFYCFVLWGPKNLSDISDYLI